MSAATSFEDGERANAVCIGCGAEKRPGLIVCWACWSRHRIPFRKYPGSLLDWLRTIARAQ